jgi:hypothetical protein
MGMTAEKIKAMMERPGAKAAMAGGRDCVFSEQPKALWLINSGYNLVSFVVAGIILAAWR